MLQTQTRVQDKITNILEFLDGKLLIILKRVS